MEIILFPVTILIQLIVHLFMVILGSIFNIIFRSDKTVLADSDIKLKPPNPWFVFFSSLVATLLLGCVTGGLAFWFWGTGDAFLLGFGVFAFLGFFASVSAATGEPLPM